jgi:hypothetical protein
MNVSRDGVQLTSPPAVGETIIFQSETVQCFARVLWSRRGRCGVAFDPPTSYEQVEQLRDQADLATGVPFLSCGQNHQAA